jgi:hypothetical protein
MVLVPLPRGTGDVVRRAHRSCGSVVDWLVRWPMVFSMKAIVTLVLAISLLAGCSKQPLSCDNSSVTSRLAEILKARTVDEFSSQCLGGYWPKSESVDSACHVASGKPDEACRTACREFYDNNATVTVTALTLRFQDSTTDALSCQAEIIIDLGAPGVDPIEATVPYLAQPGPDVPRVVLVSP